MHTVLICQLKTTLIKAYVKYNKMLYHFTYLVLSVSQLCTFIGVTLFLNPRPVSCPNTPQHGTQQHICKIKLAILLATPSQPLVLSWVQAAVPQWNCLVEGELSSDDTPWQGLLLSASLLLMIIQELGGEISGICLMAMLREESSHAGCREKWKAGCLFCCPSSLTTWSSQAADAQRVRGGSAKDMSKALFGGRGKVERASEHGQPKLFMHRNMQPASYEFWCWSIRHVAIVSSNFLLAKDTQELCRS